MPKLKDITKLPLAKSTEGVNVIVNDNGAAKQIAASAIGAQADFNVTDESHPAFIKNKPEVVQADWNQNDTAAADYVKNKPFYKEIVDLGIVEEFTLTEEDLVEQYESEGYTYYCYMKNITNELANLLSVGQSIITYGQIDNEKYETEEQKLESSSFSGGNETAGYWDIYFYDDEQGFYTEIKDTELKEHNITIGIKKVIYNQIDKNYLANVTAFGNNEKTYTEVRINELPEAYNNRIKCNSYMQYGQLVTLLPDHLGTIGIRGTLIVSFELPVGGATTYFTLDKSLGNNVINVFQVRLFGSSEEWPCLITTKNNKASGVFSAQGQLYSIWGSYDENTEKWGITFARIL